MYKTIHVYIFVVRTEQKENMREIVFALNLKFVLGNFKPDYS